MDTREQKEEYARRILVKITTDYFPEINPEKISIVVTKSKDYFMEISGFFFGSSGTLKIEKECFKMSEKAFIGLMAHELIHIVQQISFWSCLKINLMKESVRERLTDREVISRGLGSNLYEFQKYHDKIYKKYRINDGLTKKEIINLLKDRGEL